MKAQVADAEMKNKHAQESGQSGLYEKPKKKLLKKGDEKASEIHQSC